jgi:AraC-like DNA-binding protein
MGTLQSIFKLSESVARADQITPTAIPFLRFIHSTKPTGFNHGILKPSFCLILKGEKQIQIGAKMIVYGPGDFLVSTIEMPASGRVRSATPRAPYLGLSIEIDPQEIMEIVSEAEIELSSGPSKENSVPGAFVSKSDREVREACVRLVRLLRNPRPSKYLAEQVKREILYHLLTGKDAANFYQNLVTRQSEEGIGRAIHWIKANLSRPLRVQDLAKVAGMSVSGLHHKFKTITTLGPLQYQKQLRLVHARQLLLSGSVNVASAADRVGYLSQSQFTREYRRLFGEAPTRDLRKLRDAPKNALQD